MKSTAYDVIELVSAYIGQSGNDRCVLQFVFKVISLLFSHGYRNSHHSQYTCELHSNLHPFCDTNINQNKILLNMHSQRNREDNLLPTYC